MVAMEREMSGDSKKDIVVVTTKKKVVQWLRFPLQNDFLSSCIPLLKSENDPQIAFNSKLLAH